MWVDTALFACKLSWAEGMGSRVAIVGLKGAGMWRYHCTCCCLLAARAGLQTWAAVWAHHVSACLQIQLSLKRLGSHAAVAISHSRPAFRFVQASPR